MLPGRPKIFHGRDSELENVVQNLIKDSARVAILGAGGMGKTSLARAALHHPDIAGKYQQCFFVGCDSATTSIELADIIGAQLGLQTGKDLTKLVVQYFSRGPSCLLILDNLETVWEPMGSRAGVEEFLSLLTDVEHLGLLITMRGAERPAKVRWTRPFLLPLSPLTDDAARQTFIDIADDFHDNEEVNELLRLTDNMPLAVDLIAHLVDHEGCPNILARWKTEKTLLLSEGSDKRSSLDASIRVSLSSPRMKALPGARDLLSLLAILPDGLADVELLQSSLPIQDLLGCKTLLLSTSLAYVDDRRRLKSLVPIREHMKHFHAPSASLIQSMHKYFHSLLDMYTQYLGVHRINNRMNQISSNLGNMQSILTEGLHLDNPDLTDVIYCTLSLNSFSRVTGFGRLGLMDQIPALFPQPCDHRLETSFITEVFNSMNNQSIPNPESLVSQAKSHFRFFDDPVLETRLYRAVGLYYCYHIRDIKSSMEYLERAITLARSGLDDSLLASCLTDIAGMKWEIGEYIAAQKNAHEALRLATLSGNSYQAARALWTEASCYRAVGECKDSASLLHRARMVLEVCSMPEGDLYTGICLSEAETHLLKSEYAEARKIYSQIIQNKSAEQDMNNHAYSLLSIARIDVAIGATEHNIQQSLEKANKVFRTFNQAFIADTQCEIILAELKFREGDVAAAASIFQKCLNLSWSKDTEAVTYCLEGLAYSSHSAPLNVGQEWIVVYLAYAHKSKQKPAFYKALSCLGDLFLSQMDADTAQNLFLVTLEGFTQMDIHQGRADSMLRLGDVEKQRGDLPKATQLWREARPLFERSLQSKDIALVDGRLADVQEKLASSLALPHPL
ncbi:hypothetical protein DFH09DRAFT_1174939 [Mycena vulgaris]|nr:hypothetical protein DFH09DRAFT_1174939 [Mycena vulgaris]